MSAILEKLDQVIEQYDEYLQEVESGEAVNEKPRFEVTDKSSAEWVMRKLNNYYKQIQENNSIVAEQIKPYQDEIDNVKQWRDGENSKITKHIDFLTSLLEPFHRSLIEIDPKAKTIKLPHGTMKIKKQQPEIEKDNNVLLGWLKENQLTDFIKTEETPKWGELKKVAEIKNGSAYYKETGDLIEGVTATDRPDKFEVEVE